MKKKIYDAFPSDELCKKGEVWSRPNDLSLSGLLR